MKYFKLFIYSKTDQSKDQSSQRLDSARYRPTNVREARAWAPNFAEGDEIRKAE